MHAGREAKDKRQSEVIQMGESGVWPFHLCAILSYCRTLKVLYASRTKR